jgi:hypothetical protein
MMVMKKMKVRNKIGWKRRRTVNNEGNGNESKWIRTRERGYISCRLMDLWGVSQGRWSLSVGMAIAVGMVNEWQEDG